MNSTERDDIAQHAGRARPGLSMALGLAPAVILMSFLLWPPTSYGQAPATPDAQGAPPALSPSPSGQVSAADLLKVPASNLYPGALPPKANIPNPVAGDPDAANRGMQYYNQFNCVGCHAPNGAGGIGPALGDPSKYHYGTQPAQIFMSINQGRPMGMPMWGNTLPPSVIWDLVAYIESINKTPPGQWGQTVSLQALTSAQEQVPAETLQTTQPWAHLQPFSFGMKPNSPQPTTPMQSKPEQ